MNVKTVGALAALGMTLTSVTVWSVTPPADIITEEPVTVVEPPEEPDPGPAPFVDRSSFTDGATLMLEGRLGHPKLQAGKATETYLLANVTADAQAAAGVQSAVNLSIVIDRSGSMKGKRLQNALTAARGMITDLRDGDVVSVITYNTEAETLFAPTTIDAGSRQRALASLANIVPKGDTCISCAVDAGMAAVRQRSGMVDRILLLTDGEPTKGVKELPGFRTIAAKARKMGCAISSIGVDVDYNERVLSELARGSNGRHHFVENPEQLTAVFKQERDALLRTVAKGAELVIELAPGVQLGQVYDRTFRRDGNRIIVPLGTFSGAEKKTALVRLALPKGAEGERAVADIRMNYQDLAKGAPGKCGGSLAAWMTTDPAKQSELDPLVATRLELSATAGVLQTANSLFAKGDFDGAQKSVQEKLAELRKQRAAVASRALNEEDRTTVDKEFGRQVDALGGASQGFAKPPPAPGGGPPKPTRKNKAQTRSNAKNADHFSL